MADLLESIQLDVEELLEDLKNGWENHKEWEFNQLAFDRVDNKGENIMFCCPFHTQTDAPACGILSQYPYTFNCFSCGTSGGVGQLVAYALGLPTELHGLYYIQKHYLMVSVKDRPRLDIESILSGGGKGDDLSKKRTIPNEEALKYTKWRHEYITNRGFSIHTVNKYEVGYDAEALSITFPVRTSKGLIRFINRRGVVNKTFLNEKNIYKKDILYGLWYLLQSPNRITEIYLNESITDTMSCYESRLPACAVMGRILFKEQIKEMMLAGIKSVNLFFDNDRYGVSCTIRAYALLSKTSPIRVNVVLYPGAKWGIDTLDDDEIGYKDANNLLQDKMMHTIQVVPYFQYLAMLDRDVREELVYSKLEKLNPNSGGNN
jgi:DNA primase